MKNISIGKLRGLQRLSSSAGTVTVLALDHRQNLRRALNPENPSLVSDGELSRFKLDVTAAVAGEATAVLLDPEYSAAQAVSGGLIPGNIGLVVAVEATGYTGDPNTRQSQVLPGWSVEKVKRMGADAVKLLVYYHPESSTATEVETFVRQVGDDCAEHDIALMLEPLSYSLGEEKKLTSEEKHAVVIETARRLTPLGVDVLKAEFPLDTKADQTLWGAACAHVSSASHVPWILLSAAVDFDTYLRQVTAACNAGASGIAVGRAVWKEAVNMDAISRPEFLRTTARQRVHRLNALCDAIARPLSDFYTAEAPFDWYQTY
jgi:tagatose-1,6-bisphosphate aldolase